MKFASVWSAFASLAMLSACAASQQGALDSPTWTTLFDGATLEGWTQVNGKAPYEVRDGVIRGTNVLDTPNSFLATTESYGDFILEFESRSQGAANTGVQFRTDLAPGTWSGVVGYQLDIDPTDRRWTGGIYHEGVHVWRHTMARNEACQLANQHGAWNSYRIEAVGNVIATWVNGVACAHMAGDHHDRGMVALQVHSIGQEDSYLGSFTEWRNLRLLSSPSPDALWMDRRNPMVEGWLMGELSDAEIAAGWQQLPGDAQSESLELPQGGFELVFDIQLSEAADANLYYALSIGRTLCRASYQVFDDAAISDARADIQTMGSLTGQIAAQNLSEPGRPKRYNAEGKWNRVRLLSDGVRVQHWLNGVKTVDYGFCDPAFASAAVRLDGPETEPSTFDLAIAQGEVRLRDAKYRSIAP
ncbi:MAG: DUF1080 domain-containing protein [Pseudomonadota bacterium]